MMSVFDVDMLCHVMHGVFYLKLNRPQIYLFSFEHDNLLTLLAFNVLSDADFASNLAHSGPRTGFRTVGFHVC